MLGVWRERLGEGQEIIFNVLNVPILTVSYYVPYSKVLLAFT